MGMKEGAGDDPFADSPQSDTDSSAETDPDDISATTERTSSESPPDRDIGDSRRSMAIPYKFRRGGVKDGRERIALFLQDTTIEGTREAANELERRFEDDISKIDLREALILAGTENVDDVEKQLEEWGYGMEFDE